MFKFRTYLPGQQKYVYSRQMTSREHFELSKAINNRDDDVIRENLREYICEWFEIHEDIDKWLTVDIFCMLLSVRIMSVSETITLSIKDSSDTKRNYKVDLYNVLDGVTNNKCSHINQYTLTDSIKIETTTGRGMFNAIGTSLIDKLIQSDQEIDLNNVSKQDRIKIYNNIPYKTMKDMTEKVKSNTKMVDVPVIPSTVSEELQFNIRLNDNSMYELIKIIYMNSLQEFYNIRYILSKRCNLDIKYIEDSAPSDIEAYLNLYKQEIEAEKAAQEKAAKGKNINLPAKNFAQ